MSDKFSEHYPYLAFKRDTKKEVKETQKEKQEEEDDKLILCLFCKHPITSSDQRIEVNGSHHHTYSNPSGIIFDMGCFASADGCVNTGMQTSEFTWFPGFAWRFSLCANCHAHLGWFYQGAGNFYGLILAHLVDETP